MSLRLDARFPNLKLKHRLEAPDLPETLCAFAREFAGKAPRQLSQDRTLDEQAAMTLAAFRFLQRARPERVNVEVVDPAEEGWDAPVTVIRVNLADRPFIVDTVREYLSAENLVIHHYIYPVLHVVRNEAGANVVLKRNGEIAILDPKGRELEKFEVPAGAILFSPVWDAVDFRQLADWVLEDRLPVRYQIQMHKVIWGPTTTGV